MWLRAEVAGVWSYGWWCGGAFKHWYLSEIYYKDIGLTQTNELSLHWTF